MQDAVQEDEGIDYFSAHSSRLKRYTGSNIGDGQNSQGSKASVSGSFFPQSASITVTTKGGVGSFQVAAGSQFKVTSEFST
jgi:uncharacterized protein YgiB involved in biofilm formation